MRTVIWGFGLFIAILSFSLLHPLPTEAAEVILWKGEATRLFSNGYGYYNYAPSVIETSTAQYYWWCQNDQPYVVRDYIFYRKRVLNNGHWVWEPRQVALAPGEPGTWDSVHVCDPSVVKGRFAYRGEVYSLALFYLGTDQWDNNHNQIGVAFAKDWDGPWVKYDKNPIIRALSTADWGVGQPNAVSLDGQGRIILFYTRGDYAGTRMFVQELDFANMDQPDYGVPVKLPEAGLTSRDGSKEVLHNASLVFDPASNRFYMVRPQHPFDKELPSFVASALQINAIDADSIWSGTGVWEVLGTITSKETGFPRNHNAELSRTPFGTIPEPGVLTVTFTTAVTGDRWLWSYTLFQIKGYLVTTTIEMGGE